MFVTRSKNIRVYELRLFNSQTASNTFDIPRVSMRARARVCIWEPSPATDFGRQTLAREGAYSLLYTRVLRSVYERSLSLRPIGQRPSVRSRIRQPWLLAKRVIRNGTKADRVYKIPLQDAPHVVSKP